VIRDPFSSWYPMFLLGCRFFFLWLSFARSLVAKANLKNKKKFKTVGKITPLISGKFEKKKVAKNAS